MSDYEKTIQAIRDLSKIMSVQEWNKYAKEHNLLTTYSLKFISNMNFIKLCKLIRKNR